MYPLFYFPTEVFSFLTSYQGFGSAFFFCGSWSGSWGIWGGGGGGKGKNEKIFELLFHVSDDSKQLLKKFEKEFMKKYVAFFPWCKSDFFSVSKAFLKGYPVILILIPEVILKWKCLHCTSPTQQNYDLLIPFLSFFGPIPDPQIYADPDPKHWFLCCPSVSPNNHPYSDMTVSSLSACRTSEHLLSKWALISVFLNIHRSAS